MFDALNKCFIIAECGLNTQGDAGITYDMITEAWRAGCDAVKFQTFDAAEFTSDLSEREMFAKRQLHRDDFWGFFEEANCKGIIPLSTPTDKSAVDLLCRLGVKAIKVGSDDLVHEPLLKYIGTKGKPVILSTGMAKDREIRAAVNTLLGNGALEVALLHCVSLYPTPFKDVNLRRMSSLQEYVDTVGFSDHTVGNTAALGAVALGARIIEKHFTLDKNMKGPDHKFSADPKEMRQLVEDIRAMESALGDRMPIMSEEERQMGLIAHRSIRSGKNLLAGSVVLEDDLIYQRPGNGLMPYEAYKLIGKTLVHDVPSGTLMSLAMVEGRNEPAILERVLGQTHIGSR
jgi:N,N'-diacetyllegionaminate synthase